MSVGVAILVVFCVLRWTRFVVQDSLINSPALWFVNFWGRHGWLRAQWFFSSLLTCPWCASVWIAAVFAPIGYYFGDHPAFVVFAVASAASYITGTMGLLDTYRREWSDD